MTNNSRVQLGWDAPEEDWQLFEDAVEDEWGDTSPYAGVQIEQSWREFKADGPYSELETVAEDINSAVGRSRDGGSEKNLPRSPLGETTKVWVRVHEDVKQEMSNYADECNVPNHTVLRAVLSWYNTGGRDRRVLDKLTAVVDDIEAAFDTIEGTSTELSKSERVTIDIANHLGDVFTEADLEKAINAETSGTDYYHDEYTPRVIEYKGVKRWENDDKPDSFLPPSKWETKKTNELIENLGGDPFEQTAPTFTRKDFVRAASAAGLDISEDNAERLDQYRENVLTKLGFIWNARSEVFEPGAGADQSSADEDRRSEAQVDADVTSYAANRPETAGWVKFSAGSQQEAGADD